MVTIAHISDLHCGETPAPRLDQARDAINRIGCDVVVVTGDITHDGLRREYAVAHGFFAALNAPVVGFPGNHGAPVFNAIARLLSPFARFEGLGLASRWDSKCGLVSIRSLNSARAVQTRQDWSQGVYGRQDFAASPDSFLPGARFRIIARHHPPHAPPQKPMTLSTRGLGRTLSLLEHLFLCGHLNHASDFAMNGFPHLREKAGRRLDFGSSHPCIPTW